MACYVADVLGLPGGFAPPDCPTLLLAADWSWIVGFIPELTA